MEELKTVTLTRKECYDIEVYISIAIEHAKNSLNHGKSFQKKKKMMEHQNLNMLQVTLNIGVNFLKKQNQ